MSDALDELERRVGEKWIAAAAARAPLWNFDPAGWLDDLPGPVDMDPLPPDWPQFPREQWASYPAKRTVTLLACQKLIKPPEKLIKPRKPWWQFW